MGRQETKDSQKHLQATKKRKKITSLVPGGNAYKQKELGCSFGININIYPNSPEGRLPSFLWVAYVP
jgi:hypothetical protein